MNERINAYLKQHHCRDYFNSYGETVEDEHYFMYQEDVDGLIELIVRECAGVYDKIDNGNLHMGTDDYLLALQKHFAVDKD